MECFRGEFLSESSVLNTISSVLLNKNMSEFERLLIVKLLYKEFSIGDEFCKNCRRYKLEAKKNEN